MPLAEGPDGLRKVFFEETSLVARPGVSLAELERRARRRLDHLGIDIVGSRAVREIKRNASRRRAAGR